MNAFLAARPVRLSNFLSITIGRHLGHRGDRCRRTFPVQEVKHRRPLERPLPDYLVVL